MILVSVISSLYRDGNLTLTGRLAALSYPWASKGEYVLQVLVNHEPFIPCLPEHLRSGCDLMQVFFVVDAYTDVEDAATVREMTEIVKDALRNPARLRPTGETLLGELTRQYGFYHFQQSID